jgi:hypothetical protein
VQDSDLGKVLNRARHVRISKQPGYLFAIGSVNYNSFAPNWCRNPTPIVFLAIFHIQTLSDFVIFRLIVTITL